MRKHQKEEIDKYNETASDDQKIIVGMKNNVPLSRDALENKLKQLSLLKNKTSYFMEGAMCYSPRFFDSVEITHICPSCGRSYVVSTDNEEDQPFEKITDRLTLQEQKITDYVNKIKKYGFDVLVMHMCGECVVEKFGKEFIRKQLSKRKKALAHKDDYYDSSLYSEMAKSISILFLKPKESSGYAVNIVDEDDCFKLLEFLRGNNAYFTEFDDVILLKKDNKRIRQLLGL